MNRKQLFRFLLVAAAGLPLVGCVDDSYDMSKNIDLTMGLGSEGLQLKLGNTEKIMLSDLLEVDGSLKTDGDNLYYLIEKGSTDVNFKVGGFSTFIDNALLSPSQLVADYDMLSQVLPASNNSISIPAGTVFDSGDTFSASSGFNYELNNITGDITWIKEAKVADGSKMHLYLYLEQNGTNFALKDVRNFKITFPSYVKLTSPATGNSFSEETGVYTVKNMTNVNATGKDLGEAVLDRIALSGEEGKVENNVIKVENQYVKMEGEVSLMALSNFTMRPGNEVKLHLSVGLGASGATGQSRVNISTVTAHINPSVNALEEKIDFSENLPDFLQDDEVKVKVSNPTVKFSADLRQLPVDLNICAELTSVKKASDLAVVTLPKGETAFANQRKQDTFYFYNDIQTGPYDPDGVDEGAEKFHVPELQKLIETIPDYIKVNTGDKISVPGDVDYTVALNSSYGTSLDYEILVPFSFENGLNVVYTDSVDGLNEDIKDYAADGLVITGEIYNAIPLQLDATAVPVGVDGQVIPGIHVTTAKVDAAAIEAGTLEEKAKSTNVEIEMTLDNPDDLKLLDRLRLRISAKGVQEQGNGALTSDQYLQVKNLRLKLKGNIIGNFN